MNITTILVVASFATCVISAVTPKVPLWVSVLLLIVAVALGTIR